MAARTNQEHTLRSREEALIAAKEMLEFAETETQTERLEKIIECGGNLTKAAKEIGIRHQTLSESFKRLRIRAAKRGWSPEYDMTKKVPDGFAVKGTSTLYGPDGQIKLQWVKTQQDREEMAEQMRIFVEELAKSVPPIQPVATPTHNLIEFLETQYVIGDAHVGMMATKAEAGDDFDLKIAQRVMAGAMDQLVASAQPTATALIVNLGDWFHSDNNKNQTAHSGNALDVDGRYAKIVRVGVAMMRRNIERALEKHGKVKVINAIGNHDEHSAIWISVALDCLYANEPRVEVVINPSVYTYHKFGTNLVGVTHTHTIKADKLPAVMANDQAKAWGDSTNRVWYVGHIHHQSIKEYVGCSVESFNCLAAKDGWHANSGYRSKRSMTSITLHAEYGEVARNIVNPDMFKAEDYELVEVDPSKPVLTEIELRK